MTEENGRNEGNSSTDGSQQMTPASGETQPQSPVEQPNPNLKPPAFEILAEGLDPKDLINRLVSRDKMTEEGVADSE